jgi:hypothetical protein
MQKNREDEAGAGRRRALAGLPSIRPLVAGIDVGSERHWVCAPTADGRAREVADFGATTPELIRLTQWLKQRNVESVAMESTGVYWIAPHEVLEAARLEILLVDTRQLARVVRARFDRKIADFVLCERETLRVMVIVELDDRAHSARADRQRGHHASGRLLDDPLPIEAAADRRRDRRPARVIRAGQLVRKHYRSSKATF